MGEQATRAEGRRRTNGNSVFPRTQLEGLTVFAESNGDVLTLTVAKRLMAVRAVMARLGGSPIAGKLVFNSGKRTVTLDASRTIKWAELAALEVWARGADSQFSLVQRDGSRILVCSGPEESVQRVRALVISVMRLDPATEQLLEMRRALPDSSRKLSPEELARMERDAALVRVATAARSPVISPANQWSELKQARVRTVLAWVVMLFGATIAGVAARSFGWHDAPIVFCVVGVLNGAIQTLRLNFTPCPDCGEAFHYRLGGGDLFTSQCVHCGVFEAV